MPAKKKATAKPKEIANISHPQATRKNIPSAEMQQVIGDDIKAPVPVTYARHAPPMSPETEGRNADLDPQLIWRGKTTAALEVPAPPLFIQEKVHPKALIDDLLRQSKARAKETAVSSGEDTPDLFADFNGLPKDAKSTDFYKHDGHWQNRMILGDSLQVMASLAEREGLRGKVQCIYFDPPYGIKFNSNFQWSTTSRDVKDGNKDHITREPEQVKAFRDTWRDGIHSYLTWITIDTSRVALALARARIMGARYPYYLLADSREGQLKEAEITRTAPRTEPVHGHMAHGFVYERVPHITLKSIANNAEIDVIWEDHQTRLEPLREKLNAALGTNWQEWELPRDLTTEITKNTELGKKLSSDPSLCSLCTPWLKSWWEERIARQKEIDASISAKAESEYLYDKPYQDTKKVRVAGPFTMESVSPHRFLSVDENDEVVDGWKLSSGASPYDKQQDFATLMLENLKTAGVQQAHKENRLTFSSVTAFPGTKMICGEGRYTEGESPDAPVKRAGIYIGPEFGTVSRPDLVEAAREAGDLGFDVLIACAFNYDAHSSEFEKLGIPQPRHLPPLPQTYLRPHRRKSHQPPGGRGDEGVFGVRNSKNIWRPRYHMILFGRQRADNGSPKQNSVCARLQGSRKESAVGHRGAGERVL